MGSLNCTFIAFVFAYSSFSVMHKVGNVDILYCFKLLKLDGYNYVTSVLFQGIMTNEIHSTNLFSLEVV